MIYMTEKSPNWISFFLECKWKKNRKNKQEEPVNSDKFLGRFAFQQTW